MSADIPLLLFAKAPIAGQVKTRLQSHCTPEQAAEIAKILLEESLRKATRVWQGPVLLSVWLAQDHPFLQRMASQYDVELTLQAEGDLGAKMHSSFEQFGYPAAIMGCDAPHVSDASLAQAYASLSKGQSVLGPSEDGGYYLVGLTQPAPSLFVDMEWGTNSVLADTQERARDAKLSMQPLSELNDVDEWADVVDAAEQIPVLGTYLKREFSIGL